MQFQIRTYQQADLSNLTEFLNLNSEYDTFSEKIVREKLEGDPFWDQGKALICYQDHQILGFMQGVIRDIRGTRYGYIKLMAVDKDCRRQGIASKLYSQLENQFIEIDGIIYEVTPNIWTHQLLGSLHF